MQESENTEVQDWLQDIMLSDDRKFDILGGLRKVVFDNDKNTTEILKYGGIMFSCKSGDVGGIFPSKNHVSFEFGKGYMMSDPKHILEGSGKFRRHLKIEDISDIEEKKVDFFVKQAIKL